MCITNFHRCTSSLVRLRFLFGEFKNNLRIAALENFLLTLETYESLVICFELARLVSCSLVRGYGLA